MTLFILVMKHLFAHQDRSRHRLKVVRSLAFRSGPRTRCRERLRPRRSRSEIRSPETSKSRNDSPLGITPAEAVDEKQTRTPLVAADRPTSLDLYLKEIGRYPLLTREQEVAVARRARAGDVSAAEALVTSNLRFVVMMAKKYQNLGLPLADLIHEGNLGMLRAVPTFDPDHGARFVSYASLGIRQAIYKALGRAMLVRPKGADEAELSRIRKHATRLAQLHRREPALSDVAHAAGVDIADAAHALNLSDPRPGTRATGADGLLELVRSHDPLADIEAYQAERVERIAATLNTLPAREALILRLKFGLEEGEPMTNAAIAEQLGISAERVRQLVEQALKRMREPVRAVWLMPFL